MPFYPNPGRCRGMRNGVVSIILGGVGGQGLRVASRILGEASVRAGFDVKIRESHGLAQREGSVVSHVRIGKEVHSFLTPQGTAQALVSLEMSEGARNIGYLRPNGVAILNDKLLYPVSYYTGEAVYPNKKWVLSAFKHYGAKLFLIDAESLAKKAGDLRSTNVVMLGALAALDVLPFSSKFVLEAVRSVIPHSVDVNVRAFKLGIEAARSMDYET
ncbi:MAG: indolepyruvate ferredoxin oxidoreductase subunit beta [Thermoproteota archaeon]|nr:MAG: indolepyruvate ferredoxin oxidoreductase subunit beta [Candidatus Korarchaeota archaeon]